MITDIDNINIPVSYTVSRVRWKLLEVVYEGDDEDNSVSFKDEELLEDVLRFGTLSEVSKRKGVKYEKLLQRWQRAISRLEERKNLLEYKHSLIKKHTGDPIISQLRSEIAELRSQIDGLKNEKRKRYLNNADLYELTKKYKEEADEYKRQYKATQKMANELKQYNDRLQRIYDRLIENRSIGRKTKKNKYHYMRIQALENMLMRVKIDGPSALENFKPVITKK